MGSIGPAEILVVLVVALVVLGPNRLPEAARSVGRAMNELRRVTSGVQAEMRDALAEPPPSYPQPPPPPGEPGDATQPPSAHVPPPTPHQAELPGEAGPEQPQAS